MDKTGKDVKTSQHATRYFFVGVGVTAFNYVLYTIFANLVIKNNDLLWLSTLISTTITTLVAYIAHSKITWKEHNITKLSIIKFFIWNALFTFAFNPILTQLFSLFTPLYEFAYDITTSLHLPFSYEFVFTTGAFVLTGIVAMIINFFFYDKFVFGRTKPSQAAAKSPQEALNESK